MRRVYASTVKVAVDSTGGLFYIDWDCPYCYGSNIDDTKFTDNIEALKHDFEVDRVCFYCGKAVTVMCTNAEEMF